MTRRLPFLPGIGSILAGLMFVGCGAPQNPGAGVGVDPGVEPESNADTVFEEELGDASLAALGFVEDELIVHPLPGADAAALADAYAAAGAVPIDAVAEVSAIVLSVEADRLHEAADELAASGLVESVRKNYLYEQNAIPNDARSGEQTHLTQLGLPAAWDITTGSASVVVAVLDTGVLPTHEDLKDKLLAGFNVVDNNVNSGDVHGHGTAVAGSAAATSNNGLGVAGACWECAVLPVRVSLPDGRASSRAIASAILWAVNQGAKVINISFGPLEQDKTVLSAAQFARNHGCLVFIAAGNEAQSKTAADNESALFVAAVDETSARASFSNTGPFVDLAAPGVRILTTDARGGYARYDGTSFSSPIAAGIAALVWSVEPGWRPATVEGILRNSAVDLGSAGRDSTFGAGLVHAGRALERALATTEPSDQAPPQVSIREPADGASVTGKIKVKVEATDASGVADVVLSIDGVPSATDTTTPYTFLLDTAQLAGGSHTLQAAATDVVGNRTTAGSVRVSVGAASTDTTAPTATIVTPSNGATVIGTVEARALMTDNQALARVDWSVDGKTQRTQSLSGVRAEDVFYWRTSTLSKGGHTLTVKVTDAAGRSASASVSVRK